MARLVVRAIKSSFNFLKQSKGLPSDVVSWAFFGEHRLSSYVWQDVLLHKGSWRNRRMNTARFAVVSFKRLDAAECALSDEAAAWILVPRQLVLNGYGGSVSGFLLEALALCRIALIWIGQARCVSTVSTQTAIFHLGCGSLSLGCFPRSSTLNPSPSCISSKSQAREVGPHDTVQFLGPFYGGLPRGSRSEIEGRPRRTLLSLQLLFRGPDQDTLRRQLSTRKGRFPDAIGAFRTSRGESWVWVVLGGPAATSCLLDGREPYGVIRCRFKLAPWRFAAVCNIFLAGHT